MAQQMGFIALGWVYGTSKGGYNTISGVLWLTSWAPSHNINEICSSSGGVYDTLNRVYSTSGGDLTPREGLYHLPGCIRRNKRGL